MQRLPEVISRVSQSNASIDDWQQWLANTRGELQAIGQGCRLDKWRDTCVAIEVGQAHVAASPRQLRSLLVWSNYIICCLVSFKALSSQVMSRKENIESTARLTRNTISDLKVSFMHIYVLIMLLICVNN